MNAALQYSAHGLVMAAFGESMWTARILSARFAVASVLATQRLGRLMTGSRRAGAQLAQPAIPLSTDRASSARPRTISATGWGRVTKLTPCPTASVIRSDRRASLAPCR